MGKGTKIFTKIVSSIILLLILLPVIASLTLSVPSVQNYAVRTAASFASQILGTKVSIDHITFAMMSKVKVRGFYVEDFDRDTLIYAGTVTADIGSLFAHSGQITISSASVEDGCFNLRETERGVMNIKEVTDRLSNPDKKRKGGFKLVINSLDAANLDFRLQQLDAEDVAEGVNYQNMYLQHIDSHIDNFYVDDGAVGGDIATLNFAEQSGFTLDDMYGTFYVYKGKITIDKGAITSENTHLNIPSLAIVGKGWESYKDFIRKVRLDIEVRNSSAHSNTVGYFAPAIWGWECFLSGTTLSMHGTVANFRAQIDKATLEDGGTLQAKAKVRGLTNIEKTHFDIDVVQAELSTPEFVRLLNNIAHLQVPVKVKPYLERTSRVDMSGQFQGLLSSFDASANVALASGGALKAQCTMRPEQDEKVVIANVDAQSLNVNALLASASPLRANFDIDAKAYLADNDLSAEASGTISSLLFNGYNYRGISLAGIYDDNRGRANISVADRNLAAELYAALDNTGQKPIYKAQATVEQADLVAMGINHRDSLAMLSGGLSIVAEGRNLDEMNGEAEITDVTYKYNQSTLHSDYINIDIKSNEDVRRLSLTSDFFDALFDSRCSYKDVAYYVTTLLARYLPQLYDEQTLSTIESKQEELREKVALLSVTTKNISPLLDCFMPGVAVAPESTVQIFMNPTTNRFVMRGESECVERYPYLISNITLNADNGAETTDSLALNLTSSELWAGALRLNDFNMHGWANNNRLDLYGQFADTLNNISGNLAAKALFSRLEGMRHVDIELAPSKVAKGNSVWNITTDGIAIDSSRIDVRSFRIFNKEQQQDLEINGVASRDLSDSLQLHLSNFSIAPFTRFTENLGYDVNGNADGYVTVRSALKDTQIEARVGLDSLTVNRMRLDDLMLQSRWDFGTSRARLSVNIAEDNREVARGYFSPSTSRYYARIRLPHLEVGLIEPLLSGIITDTKGYADVDLNLLGERRDAKLNGTIKVSDLQTTLDYTKCTYKAPSALIRVENNRFILDDAPITDSAGGSGRMNMDLSLNHLSNIEYDLNAVFRNMEVLNTTLRDNDMFYGKVYASGNIGLRGDKAGVKMSINASSDNNSHFYMPLSNKSTISSAGFVTFLTPSQLDTASYLVRRKLLFEQRQKHKTEAGGGMDIEMSLNVRENTEVQLVIDPTVGDIIKGAGQGQIDLRINPYTDTFSMNGTYTLTEGSYLFTLQNIINKKFVIDRGSGATIQWDGDPMNPLLNIDAVYKVKASLQPLLAGYVDTSIPSRAVPVNCIIKLTDRLSRPTVNFNVEVPTADASIQSVIANVLSTPESRSQQFLYLLIANSFMSDTATEATAFGVSSAAVTGFEMLSNQLSNWLSSSENSNIVLRYRPKTEQMMSDEVDFGFSHGLLNNRLLIEIEGNYLVDKSQVVNANSSFTGEAYITWLIDQAGTLRLKGFTHTIDRFDENQGLQETGLGIYFKEDFDNAKDLANRLANRFSRRRRKENRARAEQALGITTNQALDDLQADREDEVPHDDMVDNYD